MRLLQVTLINALVLNLMLGTLSAQTLQQPQQIVAQFGTNRQTESALSTKPDPEQEIDVISARLNQDEPPIASPSDLDVAEGCDTASDSKTLGKESCSGITVGGWTQLGYHTQGANGLGQGAINTYPNHFQVQQQWLYVAKDAVRGDGFDWGFRFDYVYGTDGQDVQAFGGLDWDNAWDQGGNYGHAIPQLYLELAYNELNVKLGHFVNNAGLESMPATGNAFYSHSYAMTVQPRTYTGVVADYALTDSMSVIAGWVEGWNSGFSDAFNGSMFIGGVETQLTDAISFSYIATAGDAGAVNDVYSHAIVIGMPWNERLDYFLQTDLISMPSAVAGDDTLVGITQYLNYAVQDSLDLGVRFEWFEGVTTGQQFYDLTVGAQAQITPRLVVRPEVRWDFFQGTGLSDSTTFGIDAVFSY